MLRKIVCGSMILLASCYEPVETPWTSLLASGTWQLTAWTSSPGFVDTAEDGTQKTITNVFTWLPPCARDDQFDFQMKSEYGGNYIFKEGSLKCGSKTVIEANSWTFDEESSGVYIYFKYSTTERFWYSLKTKAKIEELTNDRLVLSYPYFGAITWREEYVRLGD